MPLRRVPQPATVLVGLIAVVAVLAVVAFDLASALPFNDEFIYQWTVRRIAQGHGLALYPGQAPIALVQLVLGAGAYALHPDARLVRLTAIPFIGVGAVAVYRCSRDLGASQFFAAVAAAALPTMPVYAAAATGFMTEPYYLALLALVAWRGCGWLRSGRGFASVIALATVAALQRQHAAAIPPALTVGLFLARRRRAVRGAEWGALAVTWLAVGLALVAPGWVGLQTVQMRANLDALLHPQAGPALAAVLYLPATAGLALLALAGGLVGRPAEPGRAGAWWRRPVVPAVLGGAVVIVAVTFILPGNYLTRAGLNPVTVAGAKPDLYGWLLPMAGILGLGAFGLAVAQPGSAWRRLATSPAGSFLLVLGAFALPPLLNGDVFDRYYLPVVLPWLPLAAAAAGRARWPRAAQAWAVLVLAAGVGVYITGEQDYQAWQAARQQAELIATRTIPASRVFSGFETYGVEVVLPGFERTGALAGFRGSRTTTAMAPEHPRAALVLTGPNDRRPGASYSSLAPGRVVVVCLDPAGCD